MSKNYTVAKTTTEERMRIVNEALAISTLDAKEPSLYTKNLVNEYVNGDIEISEILQRTIEKYRA